ncbi:MAG: DUF2142 domain-containing protein [Thermoleophilaceae bacterium]
MAAVPAPLALLLVVVGLVNCTWALLTPPGQVPDEPNHIQYTQSIAERGALPGHGKQTNSTEENFAATATAWYNLPGFPLRKPPWTEAAYRAWQQQQAKLPHSARSDGGGYIWQGDNPPLYYAYEAGAYRLGEGGDFIDRLYLMRIASALLMLITATGAWLFAGEVFGRDRRLQLVAAAVAGLWPMATFVSSGVNPDAALYAFWSIAFWLGARVFRRGLSVRDGVALGAVIGVATVEKSTSLALVPPLLLALGVGWWRLRRSGTTTFGLHGRQVSTAAAVAASLLAFAIPFGGWAAAATATGRPITNQAPHYPGRKAPQLTSPKDVREFTSYLWQFYLPRLPFQQPMGLIGGGGGKALYYTWIQEGWGAFGWLEVKWPQSVYPWFAALSALLVLGGAVGLARSWRRGSLDLAMVAFYGLAVASLLFILHWAEFSIMRLERIGFNQGRYLFPLLGLAGVIAAGCVSLLPRRRRALGAGVVLAALVVYQLFSMGLVVERYFV